MRAAAKKRPPQVAPVIAPRTRPALAPAEPATPLESLSPEWVKLIAWRKLWLAKAHPYQLTPDAENWDIWLLLAGRGSGKTFCAANELGWLALTDPNSRNLVTAPTSSDVRDTCFEGDSGLLNVLPTWAVKDYNKSTHELILFNGALIKGIPGGEPERFRGPQFHRAWIDELAAFQYPQTAWDLMSLGVRLGARTKMLITTTPKPIPLLRDLMRRTESGSVVVSRASTYDNLANLATNFKDQVLRFEGTELGRQEVYGELLDLSEAGVLKKKWFKLYPSHKDKARTQEQPLPHFESIIISMDTAMTEYTHSDRTACTVWGVFKHTDLNMKTTTNALLLDCWAERLTYPDLRDRAKAAWNCHYGTANGGKGQLPTTFVIEDKGSGISLRQDLQSEGIPVEKFNPGRADKLQRANLAAPILKDGFIWLPESDKRPGEMRNWIDELMDEITIFPNDDSHDDYVDSCVQAWHWLYAAGFLHAPLGAAQQAEHEDEMDYELRRRKKFNPYAA